MFLSNTNSRCLALGTVVREEPQENMSEVLYRRYNVPDEETLNRSSVLFSINTTLKTLYVDYFGSQFRLLNGFEFNSAIKDLFSL